MEAALMALDTAKMDEEAINTIFRSAHSIKGGSATFGFFAISEFTHDLETILDQVRSGKREFSGEDINICLKSVDCMREMLQLIQSGEDGNTSFAKELKTVFTHMLEIGTAPNPSQTISVPVAPKQGVDDTRESSQLGISDPAESIEAEQEASGERLQWRITFTPGEDILKTGNDVLHMLRELSELGEYLELHCQSDYPSLNDLDPEKCYLSWSLLFESPCSYARIAEVFEWVADESVLTIALAEGGATSSAGAQDQWHIEFKPDSDILRSGNEPLRLFNALSEFGKIEVTADLRKVPALALMDHEACYLGWNIDLRSNEVDEHSIQEIFEWVLDDAELNIAPPRRSLEENSSQIDQQCSTQGDPRQSWLQADKEEKIESAHLESAEGGLQSKTVDTTKNKQHHVQQSPNNSEIKKVANTTINKQPAGENSSIRVGIDKVDDLINMVGELVITQSMLGQLGTDFNVDRIPKLIEGLSQLEQNTRELQESVMRIRMLPISFAFSRFPRMVRDLGQTLGKEIHLEMLGEQTELDKTVMEKIGDPLVHLVRNAVDHGIEMPELREAQGKPRFGTITLNAYHQGGNVVIEIDDDGKGLDKDNIVKKAVEKSIITEFEAASLNDEQVYELIFQPGFSTAHEVSDLSGRGVGMDVVKRNILSLNGLVDISSVKNQGSKITIRLPLTLAILDGQLVRVGTNTYIFPLVSIVESLQCRKEFISQVAGGCNVFRLRDDYVPIIELHKAFSTGCGGGDLEHSLMVVVEADGEKVGIVVDELLAQQQVVIKSLEKNYKRIEGVSGATILGDGTVALILDVGGIVGLAGEKFYISQQAHQSNSLDRASKGKKIAG